MDEGRAFASARENPKNLAYAGFNNSKSMSNDIAVTKSGPSMLDRFKTMLKGGDDDEDDLQPSGEEIVGLYEHMLSELIFNSKPIITDLTIIAGEHREHGEGIADAICARIVEVPMDHKLPSLYLLDSIVKNIGQEYIRFFSVRLPEVFCEAYRQVHPSLHPAMRHLFGTWSVVFPPSVLQKIEAQLEFSPSVNHQSSGLTLRASESPRPAHGIHVNPKYLEARHQFEHSNADSVGAQRSSTTGRADRTSFTLGAEKLPPSSAARRPRSSSPFESGHTSSLSPPVDEFTVDNPPRGVIERTSPSHAGFGYGLSRIAGMDEEMSDWPRNLRSNDTRQRYGTSAPYNHSNGLELQGPRALIDAYGKDQGSSISNDKRLKVDHLDMNGVNSRLASRTWQNTEEEEFDWEDMSPTLIDHSRINDLRPSPIPPFGSMKSKPGFKSLSAAPLDADMRRSSWSSQAQLSSANDSPVILEDAVPNVGSRQRSIGNFSGFHNEAQVHDPSYPLEGMNLSLHLPEGSGHQLNAKGSGRTPNLPLSVGGYSSTASVQKPFLERLPNADSPLHRSSTVVPKIGANIDYFNPESHSAAASSSAGAWPPVNLQTPFPFPSQSSFPPPSQIISSKFNLMNANNTITTQGLNNTYLPERQLGIFENKVPTASLLSNDQGGSIPFNGQHPARLTPLQPQLQISQGPRQNPVQFAALSIPSGLVEPPHNHGYNPFPNAAARNPMLGMHTPMPFFNIPNRAVHLQGGALPPLPPGPPPSLQMIPVSQNPGLIAANPPAGGSFSGLFSSLMAQGLISLTNQAPVQDSVGLEFNIDLLKVRHESAITALYADLPRQCSSCGLRFKTQEEHSSHMDWHVTKNRISRNRKQKPSRKWFVSVSMWLSGAEALGTDAVPGFLPSENVVEEKVDEELAVPADEDQNVCALCGEPFDDFYSDETEEWMYKGAVYMNAPFGSTSGVHRSQLGPIVHAKCRSESNVVAGDIGQDEGGFTEEGNQRKRLRS